MKCALIGERLGHSYSKLIHEAFGLYSYELVSLPKDKVGEFMENEEFDAFNVTIPYKRTVMPYCSYISPEAQKIGSVNTGFTDSTPTISASNPWRSARE